MKRRHGWLAFVLLALSFYSPVEACQPGQSPGLAVVRLSDGAVLFETRTDRFALSWRNSVTLTPVLEIYALDRDGIRQIEERFSAHGPGMAHTGEAWRREDGMFVITLDRPIERLVLRSAPAYENRLRIAETEIDLTQWSGVPLELIPLHCKDDIQ